MGSTLFGIHGDALQLRSHRLGLITSNIANAGTPGYKARDIDFARALRESESGSTPERAGGAATLFRIPVMPAMDGNTVEMATEQVAFAETATAYQATLGFLRGRVETVTRALKGE